MRTETEHLPEFGLAVGWAMCRNAMCENFGVSFVGEIPRGRTPVSDDRHHIRVKSGALGAQVGEIQCRYCGLSARLHSNRAIRPIARYFLSLRLPFADCPNTACKNHGVNIYEHWKDGYGGHCRREYLDQMPFWNAQDLERKLDSFQEYYNRCRAQKCHPSMAFDVGSVLDRRSDWSNRKAIKR